MKIAIAGAGIGGLFTAIALQKKGFEVQVFESAPQIKALGAGLVLAANAVKAIKSLGLDTQVLQSGKVLGKLLVLDQQGRTIMQTDAQQLDKKYGVSNFSIHRADLYRVLLAALQPGSLHTGKRCKDFVQSSRNIDIEFADGSRYQADALIAADGIHSAVRLNLLPWSLPRYAGYTCWRGVTQGEPEAFDSRVSSEIWGSHGRFGIVPLTNQRIYWFACINARQNDPRLRDFCIDDLKKNFHDYPAPVQQILELSREQPLLLNDIVDLPPLKKYAFGRVLLIGDAAHATTPNMGQGACQAIEDAAVLASCLSAQPEPEAAFVQFEALRLQRTHWVTRTSRRLGVVAQWQNPLLGGLRNQLMRLVPDTFSQKQLSALYEVNF